MRVELDPKTYVPRPSVVQTGGFGVRWQQRRARHGCHQSRCRNRRLAAGQRDSCDIYAPITLAAGRHAVRIAKPQGVRGRNSDNALLRKVLGWEASVTLEEGLAIAYRWIEGELGKSGRLPQHAVAAVRKRSNAGTLLEFVACTDAKPLSPISRAEDSIWAPDPPGACGGRQCAF